MQAMRDEPIVLLCYTREEGCICWEAPVNCKIDSTLIDCIVLKYLM